MVKLYYKKFLAGIRVIIIICFYLDKQQRAALFGKFRRVYWSRFKDDKTDFFISQRKGDCTRCGNCCQIGYVCPAYDTKSRLCTINKIKPLVCKLFPLTPLDIADRDSVSFNPQCGFYWQKTFSELSCEFKSVPK
ncbi:MAG: YkgJ family cysteine cluster protein [Deltaproteobacteria bacterium]|nr:YkgJ family cysteine cluster protein [Deltaproteobacteria bacterium]